VLTKGSPIARRLAAPAALFAAVVLAVAACGSTANPTQSVAGAVASTSSAPLASAPLASPTAAAPQVPVQAGAEALQGQMVSVIKQVTPAVVQIETDSGLGSGIIYDTAGHVVTNAHVVGSATTFKVTLADGKVYSGTLVGTFTPDDVAVIKISAPNLTPAAFGDSSQLAVGDFVMAVGNPLGLQSSVTEGIVSALGRSVSEPNGSTLPDVIQTSAAINPGNSGGALVDLEGRVVGIPTLAVSDPQLGGSAPGIGFAISSNRVSFIADQLIAGGHVTNSGRAYLGVLVRDTGQGAGVVSVVSGGPAAKAGIKAGDVIVSLNGQQVPDAATVGELLTALQPGAVVKVGVQHQDGSNATLNVTLGQIPG
jgi:putative serine protease PepD